MPHHIILYYIILYYTILILYYIILYYIMLYKNHSNSNTQVDVFVYAPLCLS